jgi:uncharacterized repeat protein (TIGR04138 family)
MSDSEGQSLDSIILEDGRYPLVAYAFIMEGLERASELVHGPIQDDSEVEIGSRHVTGQQFCHALAKLASDRWGDLAMTVLRHWNIHETIDFGNMVYLLIRHGHMSKNEEDSLEDFRNVYVFGEAFRTSHEFKMAQ